ncbi:MAG: hypothetical protein IJ242_11570 [Clostridia bacterium]|nr:hypothetical protein [Clostridia bacterium]
MEKEKRLGLMELLNSLSADERKTLSDMLKNLSRKDNPDQTVSDNAQHGMSSDSSGSGGLQALLQRLDDLLADKSAFSAMEMAENATAPLTTNVNRNAKDSVFCNFF